MKSGRGSVFARGVSRFFCIFRLATLHVSLRTCSTGTSRVAAWVVPLPDRRRRRALPPSPRRGPPTAAAAAAAAGGAVVEWQADDGGRGTDHLSYSLEDGDVVVYQTGTWYVDTVPVGDGSPPTWRYCRVGDHSQIVFTHDCEHGVVRGWRLTRERETEATTTTTFFRATEEDVEFGPEQLVARIPVEWDEDEETAVCQQLLPTSWLRE